MPLTDWPAVLCLRAGLHWFAWCEMKWMIRAASVPSSQHYSPAQAAFYLCCCCCFCNDAHKFRKTKALLQLHFNSLFRMTWYMALWVGIGLRTASGAWYQYPRVYGENLHGDYLDLPSSSGILEYLKCFEVVCKTWEFMLHKAFIDSQHNRTAISLLKDHMCNVNFGLIFYFI